MIEYGHKHGAEGVLNTNWGDCANPASIELAMYGIILGGVKSWTADTKIDDSFYTAINEIFYGGDNAIKYLKRLSGAHTALAPNWNGFCSKYFEKRYNEKPVNNIIFNIENIPEVQKECVSIIKELSAQKWDNDEVREEMILIAEAICVLAQLGAKLFGASAETIFEPKQWMRKYKEKWLSKNKESEISKIEEMVLYIDDVL